ncbi:MAG TPA: protocatechuate 3,4-dioxygenase [Burkholderiales bacterium]|nr:protocatechuate 3,4-dioxygenase [Burkholderiales bacterium]
MKDSLVRGSVQASYAYLPTCTDQLLQRRQLLRMALALGVVSLVPQALAQEKRLTPTSEQARGPFYPVRYPDDVDADLTRRPSGAPARGQVVYVAGRVLNVRGEPVAGAQIEIWQANAAGRYTHPRDPNPAPLDPNFDGYARFDTDAEGRYRFKTIKPGAYGVSADWTRPPHIHFDVHGKRNRLVTQMYFAGEPLNDKDMLLQSAWAKETLISQPLASQKDKDIEPDAQVLGWDIVLVQE